MSVEIIGTGYGKKVEVGESFLKEAVVNMWVRPPEGSFTLDEFKAVVRKQKGLCFYCSAPMSPPVTEHVTPLSRGGSNWISNIVASCRICNAFKASQTLEEFRPDLMDTFKLLKSNEL